MSITIQDIAKEAGVSIATVSRALNAENEKINFNTKQRILEIANNLQYNLRGKKISANKNVLIIHSSCSPREFSSRGPAVSIPSFRVS